MRNNYLEIIKKRRYDDEDVLIKDKIYNNTEDFKQFISNILENLQKEYTVYLLLTTLDKVKLVSEFVDKVITIKKEELVAPL